MSCLIGKPPDDQNILNLLKRLVVEIESGERVIEDFYLITDRDCGKQIRSFDNGLTAQEAITMLEREKFRWCLSLNVVASTSHCPFYDEGLILLNCGHPPGVSAIEPWPDLYPQGQGSPIKRRPMALDTATFLIVFAAALALIGLVGWLIFHFEKKKHS